MVMDKPSGPSSPAAMVAAENDNMFHTAAGVMGNMLEWYDFALFGFFSDIIADVFFPPVEDGSNENLIRSFAIFGGAFLVRPIGGLVIGYVGDKHGRKVALTNSLFLMAIPTTLMGCLPTYETAGSLSIVLLVICRLLQGISVGGQLPASLVYTVERRHRSQWGFYGSLPMVAANCGSLLGNLCGALFRQIFTDQQLVDFAWRIPFFSGILIAFVACYLHKYGDELHTNASVYDHQDSEVKNPITKTCLPENRMALVATWFTPMLWGAGFYITFVWMAIFMETLLEPPIEGAFWVNAMAMLFGMTFMLPIGGHLSDKWGRLRTMTVAAVLAGISGPFMVYFISLGNPFLAFVCQWLMGVFLSFFGGPMCAWLVESFSAEVRLTSASLGYDLSHATAAGFAPTFATLLFQDAGTLAPGILYPIFAVFSIAGLFLMYCSGGHHLDVEMQNLESQTKEQPSEGHATKNLPAVT